MTEFPTIDLPDIGNINVLPQKKYNHNYRADIVPTSNNLCFYYLKWNKKVHNFPLLAKRKTKKTKNSSFVRFSLW